MSDANTARKLDSGWYFIRGTGQRKWQCAFYDAEFNVWDAPTFVCNMGRLIMHGEIEIGERIVMPHENS